jgi:hypothetical protein
MVRNAGAGLAGALFLSGCIAAFCEDQHLDAERPEVILERYAARWQAYKCRRIAAFAARYAALIRKKLPDCLIGIYCAPGHRLNTTAR